MTNASQLAASLADRYRIERELGRGGMATVHLAHDVRHDRDVIASVHPFAAGDVRELRPELPHLG
jgi:serine/threonine-protein kinase